MKRLKTPHAARLRRHARLRKRLRGTEQRPRLAVYRSLSHIYAQVIDDDSGRTLASASDLEPETRSQANGKPKIEAAKLVGELIARRATERGISQVTFDRGGHQYHGRVEALAAGAREAGLRF